METSCALAPTNLALIIGELVTEPEWRTLPGDTKLFSFSLTVRADGSATTSVPLVWYDPPKRVKRWSVGVHIVAAGPVVRRFYQARGVTASRTEVTVQRAERFDHVVKSKRLVDRTVADFAAAISG